MNLEKAISIGLRSGLWDATVFTKNRDRLLAGEVASRFVARLIAQPAVKQLLSREHFSVDGTLIEAWASIKSFRPLDEEPPGEDGGGDGADGGGRNQDRDFHGARWSNATHRSTTDADCLLYRKGRGKEAKLSYMGHALMETRHGLVVDGLASRATGSAECLASQVHRKRIQEVFAWVKTVAGLSKTRHRGLARVDWQFTLALAAYDLIRLPKLLGAAA